MYSTEYFIRACIYLLRVTLEYLPHCWTKQFVDVGTISKQKHCCLGGKLKPLLKGGFTNIQYIHAAILNCFETNTHGFLAYRTCIKDIQFQNI